MKSVCLQLEHFEMRKLHIDFLSLGKKTTKPVNMKLKIDIRLNKITNKPRHYKLLLSIKIEPKPQIGYQISADILGYFYVPEPILLKNVEPLVQSNGTLILYGILRGELAVFTGSFPGGKLSLPTIPIPSVASKKPQ